MSNERVVCDQRKAQGRRLVHDGWVEIYPVKCRLWLRKGRFDCAQIANAMGPAGPIDNRAMEVDDLAHSQVMHESRLGQAAVEFFVLSKDALGGGAEFFVAIGKQIGDRGTRQLAGSDSQAVGLLP